MATSTKILRLVILSIGVSLLASSPAFAADFAKGEGDDLCKQGYRLATKQEVGQNSKAACNALESWDIARLAGGGSMGGSGYKCEVKDSDSRDLGHSLCVKDAAPLVAPSMFNPDPGKWYRLRTQFQGDNRCLEGNDPEKGVKGGNAFLDACNDVSGQVWKFVSVEGQPDHYRMKTQFQGDNKCLEGNQSGSPVHGGAAFLDTCQNVSGQVWRFEKSGDWLRLKTMFRGEGECLEGNDPLKGVKDGSAFMDKCQNVSGQLWSITP